MAGEWYKKYRPKTLKEIIGQEAAVSTVKRMVLGGSIPHCVLLVGPSGVGKTTIARILKDKLKCSTHDFKEINCALVKSVMDTVQSIQDEIGLSPMMGPCRIWYMDEFQSMSRATFSQQAMLKILEDTPSHAYFILAATDPTKIIRTIRTRSTEINLTPIKDEDLVTLLKKVGAKEGFLPSDDLLLRLVERSEGSARKALVLFEQVSGLASESEQLKVIESIDDKKQAIDLCRALLNPKSTWTEVAAILKNLNDEPESARRAVLGYAASVMLKVGNGKPTKIMGRASTIINAFEPDFYSGGKASLVNASYQVVVVGD